jgi:hypothetical protein
VAGAVANFSVSDGVSRFVIPTEVEESLVII